MGENHLEQLAGDFYELLGDADALPLAPQDQQTHAEGFGQEDRHLSMFELFADHDQTLDAFNRVFRTSGMDGTTGQLKEAIAHIRGKKEVREIQFMGLPKVLQVIFKDYVMEIPSEIFTLICSFAKDERNAQRIAALSPTILLYRPDLTPTKLDALLSVNEYWDGGSKGTTLRSDFNIANFLAKNDVAILLQLAGRRSHTAVVV